MELQHVDKYIKVLIQIGCLNIIYCFIFVPTKVLIILREYDVLKHKFDIMS